jgi:hypothetical protein
VLEDGRVAVAGGSPQERQDDGEVIHFKRFIVYARLNESYAIISLHAHVQGINM